MLWSRNAVAEKRRTRSIKRKEHLLVHAKQPSLMQCCHQIREEALPMYYARNTFLWQHVKSRPFRAWSSTLREQYQRMLKDVRLGFECECPYADPYHPSFLALLLDACTKKCLKDYPAIGRSAIRGYGLGYDFASASTILDLERGLSPKQFDLYDSLRKVLEEMIASDKAAAARLESLRTERRERVDSKQQRRRRSNVFYNVIRDHKERS